ncbi:Fructose-1,6-bisphosphatase class 3 [Aduncisulcus paluster]|uniref:Fructose-1,6-bisphosphatase class 3 n=2 Tax=Aduncisulcus paluster TaxID=2918883 RepID=A0ABQ5KXR4_9EUKA|nr:Fructose-1,6-bisphosphatase class 3 [Aduncisulcus paluster]
MSCKKVGFSDTETIRLKDHLKSLRYQFPNEELAATELINLSAILSLPKSTEQYISDIHGEFEAFDHLLRSGSGNVRKKIDKAFSFTMPRTQRDALATLIYYPGEKLPSLLASIVLEDDRRELLCTLIYQLVLVTRLMGTKYTRSKVYKMMPDRFKYIMDELLNEQERDKDKDKYYMSIIRCVVSVGQGPDLIIALCHLIQRLAVDKLHIVGDIYDRGPGAHLVLDSLMDYHDVDIQFGNHDVLWLGAAAGSLPCIATAIRISLRYMNLETLETGYGINLLPLARMASSVYNNDPCERFHPKTKGEKMYPTPAKTDIKVLVPDDSSDKEEEISKDDQKVLRMSDVELVSKMQKAIAIIQFKVEGQIIEKRPIYKMGDRNLLHRINFPKDSEKTDPTKPLTITLPDGSTHELLDSNFPTIDPSDPYALTAVERDVLMHLQYAFTHSATLQKHCKFLMDKGSLYKCYNGALLFHGCVPLDADGKLSEVTIPHISDITGKEEAITLKGKALYDLLDQQLRDGFFLHGNEGMGVAELAAVAPSSCLTAQSFVAAPPTPIFECKVDFALEDEETDDTLFGDSSESSDNSRADEILGNRKSLGQDCFWMLWCFHKSPLFGRNKMATFESYFIADKTVAKEIPDPFFSFRDDKEVVTGIINNFDVKPMGGVRFVVCGHTPVKVKKGEQPVKADGKMLCIDGGFSSAYHKTTGIAGFTLVCDSHELFLCQHKPFTSKALAITDDVDMTSRLVRVTEFKERMRVRHTDDGHRLAKRVSDLKRLLIAYQNGTLKPMGKGKKKVLMKFSSHLGKNF